MTTPTKPIINPRADFCAYADSLDKLRKPGDAPSVHFQVGALSSMLSQTAELLAGDYSDEFRLNQLERMFSIWTGGNK